MDEATLQNVAAFYTEERLADWESYDPAGAQALRDALSSGRASATLYGLDGIPLDTITQQQYLMEGSFDAAPSRRGTTSWRSARASSRARVILFCPPPQSGAWWS